MPTAGGTVDLALISDDAGAGLEDLHEWLRQEPELRGRVAFVEHDLAPGELGSITDALSIAISGGGALSVLAASLKAFFAQPRRADLRITVRSGDGRSVEIDAKRIQDVEAVLRAVFGRAD
jgi:hypothetical protein